MDKGDIAELLRVLTALDGPTGSEGMVQERIQELCRPHAAEVRKDALGNVIARVPGAEPPPGRVMLAAHADEIGMVVTRVQGGFLHVARIGGADPRLLTGQEVTVYPSGPGCERYPAGLTGYIGSRPPHVLKPEDRNRAPQWADLRVDLGFDPAGAVRVGDHIAVRGEYTELMNGRVAAKAFDDRASVAAMIGALGYLQDMRHRWEVYAVATVQEELRMAGSTTAAFGIAPDIAIIIDVTFADTPGVDDEETVPWDAGPSIAWGPNVHPGIARLLRNVADATDISYVDEALPGSSGTDAWAIQMAGEGVPCGILGIPLRYMHSAVETVAVSDVDRTARLLAACITRLDDQFLAGLPEEV